MNFIDSNFIERENCWKLFLAIRVLNLKEWPSFEKLENISIRLFSDSDKKLPEKKLLQKNDFMRFRICIILKPRSVGVGKILIGNIFVEAVSGGFDATACSASMAAPGTVKLLEPQSLYCEFKW